MKKFVFLVTAFCLLLASAQAQTLKATTAAPSLSDGSAADWGALAASVDYETTVHVNMGTTVSTQFQLKDAVGDDNGPGSYVYPTDAAWSGTEYDVSELRIAHDADRLYFLVQFAGPDSDAFGAFAPRVGIYIDRVNDTAGTNTMVVADHSGWCQSYDADFASEFNWDHHISNRGGFQGAYHYAVASNTSSFPGAVLEQENNVDHFVELSIPWSAIGGVMTGVESFKFSVIVASEDSSNVRGVDVNAGQYVFGGAPAGGDGEGGCTVDLDADVIDVAGGASAADQSGDLTSSGSARSTISATIISVDLDPTLVPVDLSSFQLQ